MEQQVLQAKDLSMCMLADYHGLVQNGNLMPTRSLC